MNLLYFYNDVFNIYDYNDASNIYDYNDVSNIYDVTKMLNVIYLDFQKTFDKVFHKLSLNKLELHGTAEKILKPVED